MSRLELKPPSAATPASAPVTISGPLVPLVIGSALFMQMLDSNVVTNALPVMSVSLHENPLTLNLAITSYLLAAGVFLPISGWAADRFGAKPVFRAAIILFTVASLLCGLSNNLPELVAARLLQGFAGAMMTPVGRLLLLRTAPKSELVQAMNYVTMPAMLGPVLGPPIGGLIVTGLSWRWIFFINIPFGVLGVLLVSLFVPDVRDDVRPPLDGRGFLLTGLGLAGVMFALENIGKGILPPGAVIGLFLAGCVCLGLYGLHARRTHHAILDLGLFRIRTFRVSIVGGAFIRLGLGATPFLLALLLQMGFGLSPFAAGLMTFASAAGALAMKTTAAPILRWFGFRRVLTINGVITAVTMMGYALFQSNTAHAFIVGTLLIGGFFRSLQFTALNALAYADIPASRMSGASSVASMSVPLAQLIGVALAAVSVDALQTLHGARTLVAADISPVFLAIGAISLLSEAYFWGLPHDAGAELSGRPRAPRGAPRG
jgi:EmrB/QacA subfamily drug resistance transporter